MTQPTTQSPPPKAPKSGVALNTRGSKPAAPKNEAFDKEVDEELQDLKTRSAPELAASAAATATGALA